MQKVKNLSSRSTTKAERKLYFSIWILILLGVAIWKFWPKESKLLTPGDDSLPNVTLGKELLPLFTHGKVKEQRTSKFVVELFLAEAYRARLGTNATEFPLNYQLRSESSVLDTGIVACRIESKDNISRLTIPNPKRVWSKSIYFTLAQ